jgi:hypothetical protein
MIDGPYKNIIPEKIKLPEANEDIESVVNGIKNLKSEIENDIAEIGGEDEMEDIIKEDEKLLQEFDNRKKKLIYLALAAVGAAFSFGFGKSASDNVEGENLNEIMKSLTNSDSIASIITALGAILSLILVFKVTQKERSDELNKNQIDQI